MQQIQFQDLINNIDELLASSDVTNRNKEKLKKAKSYLQSPDKIDWEKGLNIAAKVITGANTIFSIIEKIWDWLHNLF